MVIDINQINAEKKNEFEILFNEKKEYFATTPFININGIGNLEKLRQIQVFDNDGKEKYISKYSYIDNKVEEFLPLKYLVTKSQKFDQFTILNASTNSEEFSIYFEIKELFNDSYIIKKNDKIYNCYFIEDGHIIHIPIYDGDIQIGEFLKPQVVIDAKDNYRVYLKDEYSYLADAIVLLALYLDRLMFNSSYIKYRGAIITYSKSYSKVNKYYNSSWISNNFDANDYFKKIDINLKETKEYIKKEASKTFIIIGSIWACILIIGLIILIIEFFK